MRLHAQATPLISLKREVPAPRGGRPTRFALLHASQRGVPAPRGGSPTRFTLLYASQRGVPGDGSPRQRRATSHDG